MFFSSSTMRIVRCAFGVGSALRANLARDPPLVGEPARA
jgi:hypothetical protein